jgi:hypothetical protein
MVSSGVSGVCYRVGMLWSIGASSHFRSFVVLDGVLDSVAYDVRVCSGSSALLCLCTMRGV